MTRGHRLLPAALLLAVAGMAGAGPSLTVSPSSTPPAEADTRPADVVIVLDTSGSMEHLLDATRARLWDVVNTLGRLRPTPELRVGLMSYGTERVTQEEGWISLDSALTGDFDALYAELMSLTTRGGSEFVGRALFEALDRFDWTSDPQALKIIFVAGNESADQAVEEYDFRSAANAARSEGIIINALFAGNRDQGIVEKWDELARHGRGNFSAIDPETSTIQIPTPQDERLLALNARLNGTYLPYGPEGEKGLANQIAQDSNASRLGVQSCSSRIVAKGSALYTNASWDLVDATLKGVADPASMHTDDLPAAMRGLTPGERAAYVEKTRRAREAIQTEIQAASEQREEHIRKVRAERRIAYGLDAAMKDSLVRQAKEKGFTCDDC